MRRKTFYADVEAEYDITFNDMLDLIGSCTESELKIIRDSINYFDDKLKEVDNLYDENKLRVLNVAFGKYTLDELQEKLNIKNNEY